MEKLEKILGNFEGKRIAVFGDVMLDRFFYVSTEIFSPEEPGVPIGKIQKKENKLGGAGNVASNIISLGGQCTIYGMIGNDKEGRIIDFLAQEERINSIWIKDGRETTTKTRIIAVRNNQTRQLYRLDEENEKDISRSLANSVLKSLNNDKFDGVILQDYGKGFLTDYLMRQIVDYANKNKTPIFVDPKYKLVKNATVFKPNKKELLTLSRGKSLEDCFSKLYNKIHPKYLVVTVGNEGMYIYDGNSSNQIRTVAKEVIDVMGAGDTVIASLALAYISGANIYEACEIANHAAGIVVGKSGTATVNLDEIKKSFKDNGVILK